MPACQRDLAPGAFVETYGYLAVFAGCLLEGETVLLAGAAAERRRRPAVVRDVQRRGLRFGAAVTGFVERARREGGIVLALAPLATIASVVAFRAHERRVDRRGRR